eukprot:Skav234920  [mRNA]  locus=scaffold840:940629:942260:+ [translate_table: standard]
MQEIRQDAVKLAEQHGLFRATTAWRIFSLSCLNCWGHTSEGTSSQYASLPEVSSVDFFISHSWHCSSFSKRLALCHFLNLDMAIATSGLACLLGALTLVLRAGWSFPGVAQEPAYLLQGLLLHLLLLVFLGAYFFGHYFDSRSFWLDQLCVNQTNAEMKSRTLQAIPAFVAKSTQMMALWDTNYFQRLWCNFELALHAKFSANTQAICVVPTWMPVWVLSSFAILAVVSMSTAGQPWGISCGGDSIASVIISDVVNVWFPSTLWWAVLVAFPFSWLSIQKVEMHKLMLHQMEHFDFRSAQCAVESDRGIIEEEVVDLFDEAFEAPLSVAFGVDSPEVTPLVQCPSRRDLRQIRHITSYPTHDEVIEQFNAYVRGPLRESVEESIGKEEYISLKSCIAASLPLVYNGALITLGRYDKPSFCGSVKLFMISDAIVNIVLSAFFFVCQWPLALRTSSFVAKNLSSKIWQKLLGPLLTALAMLALYTMWGLNYVPFIVLGARSPSWLSVLCAGFAVELWAASFLFRKQVLPKDSRSRNMQLSCHCAG